LKAILKFFRNNKFGNKVVRTLLRRLQGVFDEATIHWPLYGCVDMKFQDIRFKVYSEADDHVASALYYNKPISESRDLNCFLNFAQQSKVILDIGANVGIYSILCSKINSAASIYAFEPNKINADRFRKNVAINELGNVKLIEKAVGDVRKHIKLTVPANDTISDTSSALEGFSERTYSGSIKWKQVEVEQITIDDFVAAEHLPRIDLIKIDVEGYEMMVFEGALECISKYHPIIQCEIFVEESRAEYFKRFSKEYSYTIYMLLKEGLLKLDHGIQWQAGNNFILMKHVFPDLLTPVDKAVKVLFNNR
jgi:FkbM family methyltransferase